MPINTEDNTLKTACVMVASSTLFDQVQVLYGKDFILELPS
ncbi:MAG: hypothetical protein A4E53_00647 [Pelotomaculum sp. PtaB.Bin104]|nr:MAG: hypothetical protein A4E53_00647 [Pelotomaculum sp. PtaB.Bin104]